MTDRPYQLLPPLAEEQLHLLRQSIEKNGVLEPVVFDEDGEILDGHHRVEIAEELDIDYPRRVVSDLDEAGKRRYAITTNVARRQLSSTVRGSLVAQLRTQGLSIRKIAEDTGLPKSTVSDDIRQLSDAGQLKQPERIKSRDGRSRPSTRPTKTPGPSDAATETPSVDPGATSATAEEPTAIEPDPTPQREAQVEAGRRSAATIVQTVQAEVVAIVVAVELGESDLITAELVEDLQGLVDVLAARVEVARVPA